MLNSGEILALWKEYYDTYLETIKAIDEVLIQSLISREVLKDFPANLPSPFEKDTIIDLPDKFVNFAADLERGELPSMEFNNGSNEQTEKLVSFIDLIYSSLLMRGKVKSNKMKETIQADLEYSTCSQSLIVLVTYIEAFLSHTLHSIFLVQPQVLQVAFAEDIRKIARGFQKNNRTFANEEQHAEAVRERLISNLLRGSISNPIIALSKKIGVNTDHTKFDLNLLDEAKYRRNIVVHNGGRANKTYIESTGRTDIFPGILVGCDFGYIDTVANETIALMAEVFRQVSRKYYGEVSSKHGW